MTTGLNGYWVHVKSGALSRLILLSLLVGVVAGLGAIVFNFLLDRTNRLLMQQAVGYTMPQPRAEGVAIHPSPPARRWLLLVVPALGGLLSGFLVYTFAPETEGHGTDAMVDAFHRRAGIIRKRVPLIKTIASALTIGSGGSAGREGPIAQIGGGFGSALGTWLKTSERERRLLMLAGAGAGLGAVFRAPLGAALFAAEVLYRDIEFESSALVPTFIASITAYSVFCAITRTWGAIFYVPPLQFTHVLELPLYAALGLVCAVMGTLYVKIFYGTRNLFRKLPLPNHIKPALGGLALGAIGFFLPQVLGMGYGWVQLAIDGKLTIWFAITLAVMKMVATGLTIGSGGSGGVFAPSIAIGGCIGTAIGLLFQQWLPEIVLQPSAFALVGMAGFFAGVAKTPISTLIMVSEMTGGYGLLAPLMLVTALGYLLTPRRTSIYEKQVDSRIDSPAHEGEFVTDVLEKLRVRDTIAKDAPITTFRPDTPLSEILDAVADSQQYAFPVLNADGMLHGVIFFDDIRIFFAERRLPAHAVVAQDLLAASVTVVSLDEDLASALKKFRLTMASGLPVVESEDSRKLVGVLNRRDVIVAYHDRLYREIKK